MPHIIGRRVNNSVGNYKQHNGITPTYGIIGMISEKTSIEVHLLKFRAEFDPHVPQAGELTV
jgi:hypothetical protein